MTAAPKKDTKPTGPVTVPVVLTLTVPARRRVDLPDVFTAEVEQDGKLLARRHFRHADDGDGMEDVTDLVTEILLSRSRGAKAADKVAQAEQAARVGAEGLQERRLRLGLVVDEAGAVEGRTRSRALTSLGTIRHRDLLTTRQFEAGDRMAQDAKVAAGAREAKNEIVHDGGGQRCWEDFAIEANRRLNLAREVCQSMAWFEGVSPWLMVERVVLRDETLTEAAGGTSKSVQRRAKIALRIGLDAVGDAYSLPAAVVHTSVLHDGIPLPMTVTEDLDGLDRNEAQRRMWRSITLNKKPWVAAADTMSDLYGLAKARLKERR
ncbi:MAG: hypothetical protein ACLGJC_20490 [Alphaproteobacteria bacterium]